MTTRHGWAPLLVIVACWLGIASCAGGGSQAVTKGEYGKQLRATMADVEDAYGSGAKAAADESAEDRVTRLQTLQIGLRDAANRLDGITPPDSLAKQHQRLVSGVRDMADAIDLRIEAEQVAETNPAKAKQLARQFATDDSFTRVQAAATAIEEAGVDAGL